jgi:hypothetical protein
MKREELIKKFGKDVEVIPGLVEFLLNQSAGIESVHAIPEKGVAAFCLDKHWWSGSSGIGMAAIVGVYRDGDTRSRSFTYRDQYDAKKDNWSLAFNKVEVLEVTEQAVTISASAGEKYRARQFTFDIAGKPRAEKPKVKKISAKAKAAFEAEVKTAMEKCVEQHKRTHPLFNFPTEIHESVIDHDSKIAIWILKEMIDTDRCTPQGSGWLGDQFRYSVWKMESGKEPTQLYEDHAYTKERGCDIRGLRFYQGKVTFTVHDGRELNI